jgi:hypothetical protein
VAIAKLIFFVYLVYFVVQVRPFEKQIDQTDSNPILMRLLNFVVLS